MKEYKLHAVYKCPVIRQTVDDNNKWMPGLLAAECG